MIDTYNRLYTNFDKKILYIKHNSCFDLIMNEVFPNMVCVDSIEQINHYFTFASIIYNDLFEFNSDRSNAALLFHTTQSAEGKVPMVTRDEYQTTPTSRKSSHPLP